MLNINVKLKNNKQQLKSPHSYLVSADGRICESIYNWGPSPRELVAHTFLHGARPPIWVPFEGRRPLIWCTGRPREHPTCPNRPIGHQHVPERCVFL